MNEDTTAATGAVFRGTDLAPGKVIAVHVAYESRAAQRGRRPSQPSYFLKPTSSLAASGADIPRPAEAELLAFEGEIALIIGTPAHRVSLDQAWDHVAYVTAANDLGIYDYRAADKGSNLRSKGRDGFTPLGPELIDARAVDPTRLRIRTWVNDRLVQDDTTAEANMIFPLAQFVADLSQHMVLNPGDIILTGTPAGSTVIGDGDVVEVQVDAELAGESGASGHPAGESAAGGGTLTSGRLRSVVVEAPGDFDPHLGSTPSVDDTQRAEAYGSRAEAGLPEDANAIDDHLRAMLEAAPTAGLSAQLRKRGLNTVVIEGVSTNHPGTKMVGVAKTLRFVPNREDLFKAHGGGYNTQKRAFDAVKPGEVLVIEARGETGSGTLGDILALRAQSNGAAGVVTDGGVRDAAAVAEIGLPVFSNGSHPAVLGRRHVPWDADIAVACGNATVVPGDIIVGDDDGVLVIPRELAAEVAQEALAKEHEDAWVYERVAEGNPVDGLFPPAGEWKQRYQDYLAENPVPPVSGRE